MDADLLLAQKSLVAAVAVWMEENCVEKLTQSLAMAAHALVYQTIFLKDIFKKYSTKFQG